MTTVIRNWRYKARENDDGSWLIVRYDLAESDPSDPGDPWRKVIASEHLMPNGTWHPYEDYDQLTTVPGV